MHSGGLELTKLTYIRLEDNLIRHRGDATYCRGVRRIVMVECRERTPSIKKHTLPFFVAVRTAAALYTTHRMAAAAAVEVYTTEQHCSYVYTQQTTASSRSCSTTTNGKPYKYSVHMILRCAAAGAAASGIEETTVLRVLFAVL